MDEYIRHIRPLYQLLRSFIYTSIIACILVILTMIDFIRSTAFYEMLAFAILFILLIEGYFTVKYLKSNEDSAIKYHLSEHLINHFFYPSMSLFGLIFYLILENNKSFSFILIFISSILFFLYFYYLPFHIYYDHIDHPKHKKIFPRIDFVLYIFKFFTYFVTNLAIFTYYFNSLISQQFVIITNFFVNFVFLFFHIFRKDLLSKMNIFMAIVFAFFVSLFVAITPFSRVNILTSVTLLYFYLATSLFYHKVDGTFNYKTLIEYSSIGLIVSILIFTLK